MDPQDDDPEARIRELERPLTERANASETWPRTAELGVGEYGYVAAPDSSAGSDGVTYPPPPGYGTYPPPPGYGTYPPPPPPPPPGSWGPAHPPPSGSFGAPFNPTVRTRSASVPIGLLVFGIIAVVGLGIAGVFYYAFSNTSGSITSDPTIRPSFGSPPSISIRVPTIVPPVVPTPENAVPTATAGTSISVSGIEEDKKVVCDGGDVTVSGSTNVVEITGNCASVTVSGFDNVVTVESAGAITASGFGNNVTYRSGEPSIQNSGSDNTVERG